MPSMMFEWDFPTLISELRASWEVNENPAIWIPRLDETGLEPIGAVLRMWVR